MRRRWFLPILLAVATCHAQTPVVTADTPVNTNTLHEWLHSGDPRLVAWAATFAMRTHDQAIVNEMPAVLQTWTLPAITARGEDNAAHRRAAMAMLDTLIQANAKVPTEAIDAVADALPSQALILIARLPLSDSRETLSYWAAGHRSGWGGQTLARVATMLLAKNPEGVRIMHDYGQVSLAAYVVADAEEQLEIRLRKSPGELGFGGGKSCGDSVGKPVTAGWPEVFAYDLNESLDRDRGSTLIELADDRIYWDRYKENGGYGACGGVEPLNALTRHRLLAYWMGVSPKAMSWQPRQVEQIVWADKVAYQRELSDLVETQRARLRETVQVLRQKRLLTDAEAADIMPALRLTVVCEMTPCPIAN